MVGLIEQACGREAMIEFHPLQPGDVADTLRRYRRDPGRSRLPPDDADRRGHSQIRRMVPALSQRLTMAGDAQRKVAVIAANASWNLVNFRLDLIRALQAEGYRVVALAPEDDYSPRLAELGVEYQPIAMQSSGISPFADLLLLAPLSSGSCARSGRTCSSALRSNPTFTARWRRVLSGCSVINNVSGLGTAFIKKGLLTRIVTALYKLALRSSSTVFFQNRRIWTCSFEGGLVRPDQARLVPGSGIDLARFEPAKQARHPAGDEFRFLLIARLLWDKGIQEYVDAARTIKAIEPKVRCQILGFVDVDNRTAVPRATLDGWVAEGWIDYLGATDDVRPFIEAGRLHCPAVLSRRACRARCSRLRRWASRSLQPTCPASATRSTMG